MWRLTRCGDGGQTDAVILFMRGGQAVWSEVDFTDIAVFHGQAEHRAADHAGNHPNLPCLDGQGADGAQRVFQQVAQHHAQIDLVERQALGQIEPPGYPRVLGLGDALIVAGNRVQRGVGAEHRVRGGQPPLVFAR